MILRDIAVRRLRLMPLDEGPGLDAKHKLTILSELAKMGIRAKNPDFLDRASESFLAEYPSLIEVLVSLRGGDVDYVPLFLNFPEDIPEDGEYFARRIIGYLSNVYGHFEQGMRLEQGTRLDNGMVVPNWLFDLNQFGADPISQFQTPSLWQKAKEKLKGRRADSHVEWLEMEWVSRKDLDQRLKGWFLDALYSRSSIKEALHADIHYLLKFFGTEAVDFDRVVMKENQALVLRLLWQDDQLEKVISLAKIPTDLLRMFAALTYTDISLGTAIKFPKMNRKQRRAVLAVLETSSALAEDLNRYRGLWLELGRYLHPGEQRKRYPITAAAFDALRNGKIPTFNARTEALLSAGDLGGALDHLAARPALLGRKVHELLRRFPGQEAAVCRALETAAPNLTVKHLLVLKSYFGTINDEPARTVINKRGGIKVLPNSTQDQLSPETVQQVTDILEKALLQSLAQRESWAGQTVWIDPRLETYTVPLAQRAASDGILSFGRGSRIPVQLDKVLRFFVFWHEAKRRTDLDLSLIQFDDQFQYAGHVSYTELSGSGIVHSGDLQSAPQGAAEFIDVTLTAVPQKVRYLAIQVHRYSGDAFADMVCHAGWMIRSNVDSSYKSFDIKTVANKLDLHGRAGYALPLVVDLHRQEIILTDLYIGSKTFHNNVEGSHGTVSLVAGEVSRFAITRPTLKTLADLHLRARSGARAETKEQADITWGVEGCTYNAGDTEKILAELI